MAAAHGLAAEFRTDVSVQPRVGKGNDGNWTLEVASVGRFHFEPDTLAKGPEQIVQVVSIKKRASRKRANNGDGPEVGGDNVGQAQK